MRAVHQTGPARSRSWVALLVTGLLLATAGGIAAVSSPRPAGATIGVDDFPASIAADSVDPWRFYGRTCTSFVAWRMNNDNHIAFTNGMNGGWWGNATNWDANAVALGYRVDTSPAVGSIAQWRGSEMPGSGGFGHVAWVKQVNKDGSVVVEEYNYSTSHAYDQRTTRAPRYLHVADLGPSTPPPTTTPPTTTPPTTAPPTTAPPTTLPPTTAPPTTVPVVTTPPPPPFPTTASFVRRQFSDLVGRAPTSAELTDWSNRLNTGSITPDATIEFMLNTGRLHDQMAPVVRLYQAYFLRLPDQGGLTFWYQQLRQGQPLGAVSAAFALSPEFVNKYGSLANGAFVDRVYQNTLGRAPDASGRAFWIGQLQNGMSRGDLMIGFSESVEYQGLAAAPTVIVLAYEGMLGRMPDSSGTAYWTGALRGRSRGVQDLAYSIRLSPEYYQRVSA